MRNKTQIIESSLFLRLCGLQRQGGTYTLEMCNVTWVTHEAHVRNVATQDKFNLALTQVDHVSFVRDQTHLSLSVIQHNDDAQQVWQVMKYTMSIDSTKDSAHVFVSNCSVCDYNNMHVNFMWGFPLLSSAESQFFWVLEALLNVPQWWCKKKKKNPFFWFSSVIKAAQKLNSCVCCTRRQHESFFSISFIKREHSSLKNERHVVLLSLAFYPMGVTLCFKCCMRYCGKHEQTEPHPRCDDRCEVNLMDFILCVLARLLSVRSENAILWGRSHLQAKVLLNKFGLGAMWMTPVFWQGCDEGVINNSHLCAKTITFIFPCW